MDCGSYVHHGPDTDGMTISVEDRLNIHELIALHGHLSDAGDFDQMHKVFTADVVCDLEDLGLGLVRARDGYATWHWRWVIRIRSAITPPM